MGNFWLFLRVRRIRSTVGVLVALFLAETFVAAVEVHPRPDSLITYQFGVIAPVALAMILGPAIRSPLDGMERMAGITLWWRRVAHVLIATGAGMAAIALATAARGDVGTGLLAGRNLLGFSGIALSGTAIVTSGLAWAGPLLWVTLPPFVFTSPDDDRTGIWTFFVQPIADVRSGAFAVAIFACGVLISAAGGWTLIEFVRHAPLKIGRRGNRR